MACRSARSDHWACFAVRAAFGVRRSSRLAIRRFRRFLASRNRFTRRACRLSWVVVFVIDAPGGLVRRGGGVAGTQVRIRVTPLTDWSIGEPSSGRLTMRQTVTDVTQESAQANDSGTASPASLRCAIAARATAHAAPPVNAAE